jgi:WD40 repeat protein/serine/threonine protein kinase
MAAPPTLEDLLRTYEEARNRGQPIDLADLCRDCPELLPDLQRHLQTLNLEPSLSPPRTEPESATIPRSTDAEGRLAVSDLEPGQEPAPGYQLVRRLGKGGFGEVWEARAPGGFRVAFKFVTLAGAAGEAELRALEIIRNLRHPNLLSIFGTWQTAGRLIIGMELADATLLDEFNTVVAGGEKGLARRPLVRYSLDVAKVIDYLNKPRHFLGGKKPVGIQHGDIKPQNILRVGEGIKVGDFGLVQLLERSLAQRAGGLTPHYAAPEVFDGHISHWSDQYSLAVTWCHLRGGQLPFTGTFEEVRDGHCQQVPDLNMLPEEERPVVARALAKDPRQRWPNCRAFIKALADSVRPEPEQPAVKAAPDAASPDTEAKVRTLPGAQGEGFTLIKQIGTGGFSTVWLAEAPGGLQVAIRIIPWPTGDADRQELESALAALRTLNHPCLIKLHAYWVEQDRLLLVMEAAESNLGRRSHECREAGQGGLPVDEVVRLVREAAEALDYLHSQNVLHRDVNPGNILLVEGHVRLAQALLPYQTGPVASATTAGSPGYMAPEVWRGQPGKASDQYSLAITYAEMRLGRPVFSGTDVAAIMRDHLEKAPDLGSLSEAEQDVLRRALAKEPSERYPSCVAFAEALEEAVRQPLGESIQMPRVGGVGDAIAPTASLGRQPQSYTFAAGRFRWMALSLVLIGLAVAIYALFNSYIGSKPPREAVMPPREEVMSKGRIPPPPKATDWPVLKEKAELPLPTPDVQPPTKVPRPTEGGPPPRSRDVGWWVPGAGFGLALLLIWIWSRTRGRISFSLDRVRVSREGGEGRPPAPGGPRESTKPAVPVAPVTPKATPAVPIGEVCCLEGHTDVVWSVVYFPGGRFVLSASMDGTARLWNLHTLREVRSFMGHGDGVTCAVFSPVGRHIATSSLDETVRLWESATGAEVQVFRGHGGRVFAVAFTPDGQSLVSGGEDRTLRLWDVDSGQEVRRYEGHARWVNSLALSPDGKYLASGSEDRTVRLWNVASGECLAWLQGHQGPVKSVAFSPEGDRVLSGSEDRTLRLWDVPSGRELRCFEGHADWVRGVTFSPDGLRVLSGSDDETLCLWQADGPVIEHFEAHLGSVLTVAFDPDGQQAVTGGDDNTVRLWQLPG